MVTTNILIAFDTKSLIINLKIFSKVLHQFKDLFFYPYNKSKKNLNKTQNTINKFIPTMDVDCQKINRFGLNWDVKEFDHIVNVIHYLSNCSNFVTKYINDSSFQVKIRIMHIKILATGFTVPILFISEVRTLGLKQSHKRDWYSLPHLFIYLLKWTIPVSIKSSINLAISHNLFPITFRLLRY